MRTLFTVTLVTLLAATSFAAGSLTSDTQAALKSLSGLSGKAFDVAFMQALIPVHEEAVEIAMTATLNADHPDLLRWNQQLTDRKNADVRQMLGWLKEVGASPTKRNVGVVTASVKKMRSLKDAALEKAYLPLMASHLEQSTALAALAAKKANNAEIRTFALKMTKVEAQEAAMLRGWLKKWYGQ